MFPQTSTGGGISEKRDPPDYLLIQIAVYSTFITVYTVDAKMKPPGDECGLSGGASAARRGTVPDRSECKCATDGWRQSVPV